MSLYDAIAAELPFLRQQAESLMTLTLTPQVPTGDTTVDGNGYEVPEFTPQATHKGKVQAGSRDGDDPTTRSVSIGGVQRPVFSGGLHIPIGAPVPVASEQRSQAWEYVVTAVGAADDPALLGRRYMVVGVPAKSFATARRLDVVEV